MSAPDTNVETEEKKHRPSLWGIKASMIYGLGLLALFASYVVLSSDEDAAGVAGTDAAGSSMISGSTEADVLEGYKADGYGPGGNSTGTVTLQNDN